MFDIHATDGRLNNSLRISLLYCLMPPINDSDDHSDFSFPTMFEGGFQVYSPDARMKLRFRLLSSI